ncbi:MAG: HAD family phosphatase [Anaerolineales bacterium]|jgi:epoxide hydrolase-like predicted phosphatase
MDIRAVIFDFGGVIVRTEDRTSRQQLASRLGMTYEQLSDLIFDSDSARRAALGEIGTQEHWDAIRVKLGLSPQELPAVPREFWGGDSLDHDLVDYIRSLRPQYKTGLLSNAWDDLRDVLEKGWKIAAAFDAIVISAEVGVAKPDAKIYHIILDRLGVAPAEAVFVDDFSENVAGARAVGMRAIRFQNSRQVRADLDQILDSPD